MGVISAWEMKLGASGCKSYVGPVGMVIGSSRCDQWVGPVDVVTGWWIYFLPHEVSLLIFCLFLAASSVLPFQFCKLFFILVFVTFLDFSNLIKERIISMEQAAIRAYRVY